MCGGQHDEDRTPIKMPIAGPGVPRYNGGGFAVWLIIPTAVLVVTILAILCGALWR
jgi:hypothetical protein